MLRLIYKKKRKPENNCGETYIETIISIAALAMTVSVATQAMTASSRIIGSYTTDMGQFGLLNEGDEVYEDSSNKYNMPLDVKLKKIATSDDEASVDKTVPITAKAGWYHFERSDTSEHDSLQYFNINISN